jgi:hypothetical protein
VFREPVAVIVTSRGGENVAQRTSSFAVMSMRQAMFLVGERNAPFNVADCKGDETIAVAVPVTSSLLQAGGGPITPTWSRNW